MYRENIGARSQSSFINRTFNYMGIALLITFITAFFVSEVPAIQNVLFRNPLSILIIFGVQIFLVINMQRNLKKYSREQLLMNLGVYSLINGVVLSSIFTIYKLGSVAGVFVIAAGMFFCSSMIGITSKKDLTGVGRIASMGVIGLILVALVGFIFPGFASNPLISLLGVIIFCALTAYDMQKIKRIHSEAQYGDPETYNKYAVVAALSIYLDFINLFLYLLRLFGNRRD